MEKIVCVVGPTASGKTALAVQLAKLLDGEVVSCDSMQIYRGMDIGTAKPTLAEMEGIPHHMLDVVDPQTPFSVGQYVAMADPIVRDILDRGKTVILAGGTGLYVDSLIAGRTFAPLPATGQREALEAQAKQEGLAALYCRLKQVDPEIAGKIAPSDQKRILRALEVYELTGKPLSWHNAQTRLQPPKYTPIWIGLDFPDRQVLYDRINRRVEQMITAGLLKEVQALLDLGIPATATSMQAIGYRQILAVIQESLPLDQAVAQIQQESRRYAKRQLTWFRRNPAIHWIFQSDPPDFSTSLSTALSYLPFFDTLL